MSEAEVFAYRGSITKFSINVGTRPEMERAIEDRLRSGAELPWKDSPEGVKVTVIVTLTGPWRPRRRFKLNNGDGEGDR
jgi:hypothetical protein